MTTQTRRTLGFVALLAGALLAVISLFLAFSSGIGGSSSAFPIAFSHNAPAPVGEPSVAPIFGIAAGGIIAVLGLIALVYKSAHPTDN